MEPEEALVARLRAADCLTGFVQARIEPSDGDLTAFTSLVVGSPWQGQGIAREAFRGLIEWLRGKSVATVIADIHPDNRASSAVALPRLHHHRRVVRRRNTVAAGMNTAGYGGRRFEVGEVLLVSCPFVRMRVAEVTAFDVSVEWPWAPEDPESETRWNGLRQIPRATRDVSGAGSFKSTPAQARWRPAAPAG